MADNFVAAEGASGKTFKTDDVGGINYQVIKMDIGGDGAAIPVEGTAARGIPVDKCGGASSATLANVAGSASSVTLIASNASRKGAILFNDSSAILYLKFGSTASTTSFTYRITPYSTWEMLDGLVYTGIITGIWASATGSARTTEL